MTNEENSHKSRRRRRRRSASQRGGRTPANGSGNSNGSSSNNGNTGSNSPKTHNANAAPQAGDKTHAQKKPSSATHKPRRSKRPKQANKNAPPRRGQGHQRSVMETRTETSAGGLVLSGLAEAVAENGEVDLSTIYVALIGRLDRRGRLLWSMPKGHVEPDEDHKVTAEREVWEETGIHGEVFEPLGVIDYWFVSDGVRIHKTVHHHLLRFVDGWLNDEDPEVTEVSWIPAAELIERLAYADERKLARRAHDLLPDLARAEKEAGRITPR